jgi:hypothetical protein
MATCECGRTLSKYIVQVNDDEKEYREPYGVVNVYSGESRDLCEECFKEYVYALITSRSKPGEPVCFGQGVLQPDGRIHIRVQ